MVPRSVQFTSHTSTELAVPCQVLQESDTQNQVTGHHVRLPIREIEWLYLNYPIYFITPRPISTLSVMGPRVSELMLYLSVYRINVSDSTMDLSDVPSHLLKSVYSVHRLTEYCRPVEVLS